MLLLQHTPSFTLTDDGDGDGDDVAETICLSLHPLLTPPPFPLSQCPSHVPETCSRDAQAESDIVVVVVVASEESAKNKKAAHNEAENLINCGTVTWLTEG